MGVASTEEKVKRKKSENSWTKKVNPLIEKITYICREETYKKNKKKEKGAVRDRASEML